MGDSEPRREKTSAEAKELLLADFRYFSESFWKNEQSGESRVSFFIGLVTATLAAMAALLAKADELGIDHFTLLAMAGFTLMALLCLGAVTLSRLIARNRVTNEYKQGMDEVRRRFRERLDPDGILAGYDPLPAAARKFSTRRRFGGLADTVAVLNSLLVAALAALLLSLAWWPGAAMGGGAAFLAALAFFGQWKWIRGGQRFTHAGGIVVRWSEVEHEYLLVTARDNRDHWVFPKGHIETGEETAEAAQREVLEESGVLAAPVCEADSSKYEVPGKEKVYVTYFLMALLSKGAASEGRSVSWLGYSAAEARLTFDEAKRALRSAHAKLETLRRRV